MGYVVAAWFVGMLIAVVVLRVRAGAPALARLQVFGARGYGLGWITGTSFRAAFWPATLVVWLASGRPQPKTLFNDRAAERLREHELSMTH